MDFYSAREIPVGQAELLKNDKVIAKFWNEGHNNYFNAEKAAIALNKLEQNNG